MEENKENWKKHIPFYIIEGIILVLVIVFSVFSSKLLKSERVSLDLSKISFNPVVEESEAAGDNADTPLNNSDVIQDNTQGVPINKDENIDVEAIEKELYDKYKGTFNIAFFGVDSREGSLGAGTRSDSIIICSIDMDTHEIKMVSVYRDTFLNIGNGSYNKCNSAYAIGGPERALSMLNTNLDIYVDQYITVGFEGLIEAIDALGGVPIEVTEKEIFHLNNYQMAMAEQLNLEYTPVIFAGTQMLNGLQATAYCRIRYTAGDDFKRAERQRTVITAMMNRAGQVSLASMTDAVTKILPNVSTSLSLADIINMMSLVGNYEVTASEGFPFDSNRAVGNIGSKGSCVIPNDLTANVKTLHRILYDEENYEPSATVKEYSNHIKSETDPYLNK